MKKDTWSVADEIFYFLFSAILRIVIWQTGRARHICSVYSTSNWRTTFATHYLLSATGWWSNSLLWRRTLNNTNTSGPTILLSRQKQCCSKSSILKLTVIVVVRALDVDQYSRCIHWLIWFISSRAKYELFMFIVCHHELIFIFFLSLNKILCFLHGWRVLKFQFLFSFFFSDQLQNFCR